jgi:hypothetical protein
LKRAPIGPRLAHSANAQARGAKARTIVSFDPLNLLLGFVFSTFGFALFRWGRKHGRAPHLLGGIALMVSPYLCPNVPVMVLVCGSVAGAVALALRLGW